MIRVALKLEAPLNHGAFGESAGNATLCRRMAVVSLPGMPRVPCVSGNALRGTLRRLVMRDLFDRAGVDRSTFGDARWDRLYAALANGGHLEAAEDRVDPAAIREVRETLPPLSVFGAALYTWLLPGHMSVGILWPRCRETHDAGLVSERVDLAAEDLVEELSHCRHVDREHQDPTLSGVTPMPTTVEVLCVGATIEGRIEFAAHASDVERGVIAHGLDLLRTLGGKSGSGLGRVSGSHDGSAAPYMTWLAECGDLRERIVGLADGLAKRSEKAAAKGKKGKKAEGA